VSPLSTAARQIHACQEVAREERDVALALAQRRQVDGDDIQAKQEVLAECPLGTHGRQVLVRGGDHAHIDHLDLVGAHRTNLSVLQHPQQLGLHGQGHIADLIEEDRALVSDHEVTGAVGDGPGKCPAHVPEELALQQVGRHRGAILGHECPFPAVAPVVDRARRVLLTRAGLPEDQDGHIAGRDLLQQVEDGLHLRARTDHAEAPGQGVSRARGPRHGAQGAPLLA